MLKYDAWLYIAQVKSVKYIQEKTTDWSSIERRDPNFSVHMHVVREFNSQFLFFIYHFVYLIFWIIQNLQNFHIKPHK